MTNPTKLQRFYAFAYNRTWAWLLLKYLVVPVVAAVTIVRQHIPEFVSELRDEWKTVEADRKADLEAQAAK